MARMPAARESISSGSHRWEKTCLTGQCSTPHQYPRLPVTLRRSAKRQHRTQQAAQSPPLEVTEKQLSSAGNGTGLHQNGTSHKLEAHPVASESTEKYNWSKAWYPLAIESDLPTDRPTGVRLLGNSIVLWKDGEQKWRAFQDLCPHRLVPLSEGRVEDGQLMCSYHGWKFQGQDGKASDIPQADDEKRLQSALQSRRACCTVYPCEVHEGLIWVYGSSGKEAFEESKIVGRPSSPKVGHPDFMAVPGWFMRELPYGADVLAENIIDPAHVPHSHHGIQGNRFKAPKQAMDPVKEISTLDGFNVHVRRIAEGQPPFEHDLTWCPPTRVRYEMPNDMELITHAVPTDPGRCRMIFTFVLPKSRLKGIASLLVKLKLSKWLLWLDHFNRNALFDGDSVFLALQDEELRKRANRDASKNYFMPASLDFGVRALREWMMRRAQPVLWGPAAFPPPATSELPRRQLLNRFEQHTRHCKSCAGAHQAFSKGQWIGAFGATFVAAYAAFALGNGSPLRKLVSPTLMAALFGAMSFISQRFKQKLEFTDYRHPDH